MALTLIHVSSKSSSYNQWRHQAETHRHYVNYSHCGQTHCQRHNYQSRSSSKAHRSSQDSDYNNSQYPPGAIEE